MSMDDRTIDDVLPESLKGGEVLTWQQLLDEGEKVLLKSDISEAKLDAWYLLSASFQIDRIHFYLDRSRPVFGGRLETGLPVFREYLLKRAARTPLQQILGSQDFMGLSFCVNEHVLIPRQDTEKLVETVLKEHRDQDISVLDMCTGSGCIAISLALLGKYERVVAVDRSPEALKVAKKNGRRLFLLQKGSVKAESALISENPWKLRLTTLIADAGNCEDDGAKIRQLIFMEGDMFRGQEISDKYDVIVSNPPYIPSAVIEGLEPEVRDYEPRMALDGFGDGLYFYRILTEESKKYLKQGGSIYFEIGYDQAQAVSDLLLEQGYEHIRVLKDEPGLDRVVAGVWGRKQEV